VDESILRNLGVLIAALGGAAIGVERQRSGHATGPDARFGGVRTFTLLGGLAGMCGWMWNAGYLWPATVLLAGATGLVIVGYASASRHNIDGTTEVAALVVLGAGVLSGAGYLALGSAVIALATLLLVEKSRVHRLVERMDDTALRAGIRFAVMAVVILPLLPVGPYGPFGGIRPRELWLFVLFFSGLSFVGYIARLFVGARHGYLIAGLLGGMISSTSVTATFARASRTEDPSVGKPLAYGVLAACTMLFVRVAAATAVLNPALALRLMPLLVPPFVVGAVLVIILLRVPRTERLDIQPHTNPLQVGAALQMAVLFQAVLYAVEIVRWKWGDVGLVVSGAILGLADVDALMISMAKTASSGSSVPAAALAVAIGILSNNVLKLGLAMGIGRPPFRRVAALGLLMLTAAGVVAVVLFR
jgi:uncharacterized membrane protein (DUF4010 family)